MKTSIVKRLIILIFAAILLSTILVLVLTVALSEGFFHLIYTDVPVSAAMSEGILKSMLISAAIVIPCMALLAYIILKRLIRPLDRIAKVATAMTKGDFSVRADENIAGQAGLLGRTLNKLASEIYEKVSALFLERNRLQQVLNSLDEGMLAVDIELKVTHVNPAFSDMFGISQQSVLDNWADEIEPLRDTLSELSQAIEDRCTIAKNISRGALIMRVIVSPIENDKMDIAGAVMLFRDITAGEKLEHMRRNYVANVSHELRSPLTAIRALIEPLKENMVDNEQDKERYYEIIYRESLRLSRLIDDIMELSRLQTGGDFIEKNYFSLNDLLESVRERYDLLGKVSLVFEAPPLPPVYSNQDRVEQALVILLDNAFKFTPPGGEIRVKAQNGSGFVTVSVADTGCGIAQEDLPFIFERFYKADKAHSQNGAGLGLSILKEMLSVIGETVEVKSAPGKGSTFTFTISTKEN